jgi:hypothetical protein
MNTAIRPEQHEALRPWVSVIPSRKRVKNVDRMCSLLPWAYWTVDEGEVRDYLKAGVPESKMIPHPPLPSMGAIRNFIFDAVKNTIAINMVDDDLKEVVSLVWPHKRHYREPEVVYGLVENAVNTLCDLGLHLYSWNPCAHPGAYSNCQPFQLCGTYSSVAVFLGRDYRFEENVTGRSDLDMCLQVLLNDRVLVRDNRFWWNFGMIGAGSGGLQAMRTRENWRKDSEFLKQKWGDHISVGVSSASSKLHGRKGSGKTEGMQINVTRKSALGAV